MLALIGLGITVIAAILALDYVFSKGQDLQKAVDTPVEASKPTQEAKKVTLRIDGTEQIKGPIGFVKGYGLLPPHVADVRVFNGVGGAIDSLPARVKECVMASYNAGLGRGAELAEFIHHSRLLKVGEALYFALLQTPGTKAVVVSFVGRSR